MAIVRAFCLFVVAAFAEISGAYLIWLWARSGRAALMALVGAAVLFLYGVIQTAQAFTFGRAFAAYGGVFIVVALLWSWGVDGRAPDRRDWLGAIICLVGAAVIVYGRVTHVPNS